MQANVRFTDNANTNCLVAENPCFEESCKDPGSFCVARGAQFDCPCQPGYYKSNELCKAGLLQTNLLLVNCYTFIIYLLDSNKHFETR